jgi:hypothetical protein
VDAVKEQYYPIGNYDDQYMRWTTLWKERGQIVSEFTNTFHTLHTKLGIKDSERHLVLKYHGALHRYIQTEMDFLDISSLGDSYRYAVKIKKKFRHQNKREFGSANPQQPKHDKDGPNNILPKTSPSHKKIRVRERRRRTLESGVISTKSPGTTSMNVSQNSHWWPRSKTRSRTLIQNLIQKIMGEDRSSTCRPHCYCRDHNNSTRRTSIS